MGANVIPRAGKVKPPFQYHTPQMSVVAASTANVDESFAPAIIDGVSLVSGERVLLKDQTDPIENGVYVFAGAGNPMARATDLDNDSEFKYGVKVYVREGTAHADQTFKLTSDNVTVGVDAISFSLIGEIAGSGTTNTVSKFTSANVVGDSTITDDGSTVATASVLNVTNATDATSGTTGAIVVVGGIGTQGNSFFAGNIDIETANFPSFRTASTTGNTTGNATVFICKRKSSGDVVDGFGANFQFRIQDDTSAEEVIAKVSANRDGADNIGELILAAGTNGSTSYVKLSGSNDNIQLLKDTTISGEFEADGPAVIGGASSPAASKTLVIDRDYSSTGAARQLDVLGNITVTGGSSNQFGFDVSPGITINSGNTHSHVAGSQFAIPDFTVTSGTITNASTVYITGAPTEGTNNYALNVNNGNVRMNGLPTSSAGLASGTLWDNSGVVNIA